MSEASRQNMVAEFCRALGGKRPIHSILIANNGMAAVKFIHSIRAWAYVTFGTDKAILLVAMATPEDIGINAEHIRAADKFVPVPGGTNDNNYANVQLILEVAEMTCVDAVWPGWGHASENPELPEGLEAKGIIFLGPQAKAMTALGDKIGSTLIAQAAGVPTLPWSGSHVKVPPNSNLVNIPDEIYEDACVHSIVEAIARCQVVGYPAMIKASWGGGGKGIRKVHNDEEVITLFKQVEDEVRGSPIFIMKVATQSRHLEVQLLCDEYGNVAALHSRDCSVQRRHQKIIEEGPITVAPLETTKKLEQAARRLAKSVNYVGAATVEYLYSMETGEYFFLELNPRLQVEHPVTEWIADINLPAAQVAIGMGIPLWKIPEIRRFYGMEHGGGYDSWRKTSVGATPFDFDTAQSTRPKGHCVAVRVTSEDPDDGFKPTSGRVEELSFMSKPNVWAYFSIKSRGGIHEFSDSQFGHVFAYGESRALAIANMVLGLKEIRIRGQIRTIVDYSIDILNALDYKENKIHTGWLDSRIVMKIRAERPPWYLLVVGGALYKAYASSAAKVSEYIAYLEKGQIPPKHISLVTSQVSLTTDGSKYTINMVRGGPGSYRLMMNDSEIEAEIHALCDGGLLMQNINNGDWSMRIFQLDGNNHVIYAVEEVAGTRLLIDGRTCLLQNDHDPSKLLAKTSCKLLRYLVIDGSHVDAGTPYAEVEVMKMCMPLLSPASGKIHFKMNEGRAMQAGELIGKLELDDPSAVRKEEPFRGSFPVLGSSTVISGKVHQRFAVSLNAARMVLAGYEQNIDEVVQNLLSCLDNPELPLLQWQECFAALANRLPKDLRYELETRYRELEGIASVQNIDFPAKKLQGVLEAHLNSFPEKEKVAQEQLVEPLMSLVKSYEHGREGHAHIIVEGLFEDYLSVEELFRDNIQADVIEHLRIKYKDDLLKVVDIVLSHQGIKSKNKLILLLMEQFNNIFGYANSAAYRDQLIRFYKLNHTNYSELAVKANQLLEQSKNNELRSSIARSLSELEMLTQECENMDSLSRKDALDERIEALVNAPLAVEDALIGLCCHNDRILLLRVVETYVRRLYQPYLVNGSIRMQQHEFGLITSWVFSDEHVERKNNSGYEISMEVEKQNVRKRGVMIILKYPDFLPTVVTAALKEATHTLQDEISNKSTHPTTYGNVMHIALVGIDQPMGLLLDSGNEDQAQEKFNKLAVFLKEKEVNSSLRNVGVSVVSCIIQRDRDQVPMRHSFLWSTKKLCYEEEFLLRHLEPPLSSHLELDKLKDYDNIRYTASQDHQWHFYTVIEKPHLIQRMFLRTLVRQPITNEGLTLLDQGEIKPLCATSFTSRSILRSVMSAMEELEFNAHNSAIKPPDHAHMYLHILQEQQMEDLTPFNKRADITVSCEESVVGKILNDLVHEINALVGVKMLCLGVCEWEVKLRISSAGDASGAWRVVVANVTGHTCIVHIYKEAEDSSKDRVVYNSTSGQGPLHGKPVNARYKPLGIIDLKRLQARKNNMTYCYDFPSVFEAALNKSWAERPEINIPHEKSILRVTELIFADKKGTWDTSLTSVERRPGVNDVGMVAWRMEMSTPEFPSGRTIFLLSNDITFRHGVFTQREYAFFKAVTDVACAQKLPLIYLAGNSGVEIDISEDVKAFFKVGWSDETNLEHGFQYLYLTPEDYARIGTSVLSHDIKLPSGEVRWVIDTIIGEGATRDDSKAGTGAVASAYSKAYCETFTLTYVAGRNVGIGAYLGRLGMRCIQRRDQPIILTGFSTLNKLLGREVYSSHMQLGGPKIMATNGVVHLTVSDDLEGISAILKWLSFVPPYVGGPLPILGSLDPPERPIAYLPKTSCDPRAAICGSVDHKSGLWLGGMFDKDSFIETLEGWARTVVTGRAKLGGIPVGVITVDDQTVMQVIPADPAQPDSSERVVPQAGMLWFPDSATKTAQAMMDFNREGLPLFVLANWKGFSGGQRDLFEGILQAGSMIVENLRTYQQPIFMYIPMMGELRGGAWVITDSTINPEHIEMYADRTAKGNVLTPEGAVEVKFRPRELLGCMGRLDPKLIKLKSELAEVAKLGMPAMIEDVQGRIKAREKKLMPLYTQIAVKYAELHETAYRMAEEGVIKEVIDWSNARTFFYQRLYRRVVEDELIRTLRDASGHRLEYGSARNMIKEWFLNSEMNESSWMDDAMFFSWKDDRRNYEEKLQELRVDRLLSHLEDSAMDLEALPLALAGLLKKMDPSIRDVLTSKIEKVLPARVQY